MNPASPMPVCVELAPGAADNGLACMMADLVRQNVDAKPAKEADLRALRRSVAIVAEDADVALTLRFDSGRLTVFDGIVGVPAVTIRGESEAIMSLSSFPLLPPLGLPLPHPGKPEEVELVLALLRAVRGKKLQMIGLPLHLRTVFHLTRLMSING